MLAVKRVIVIEAGRNGLVCARQLAHAAIPLRFWR
jgi:hypothetical protein